ncbi:hypothetical protein J522_0319 [Acinetobacter baumannii 146457]|nr:hypothetical protein J522_0319 [Acinetobacter baumannii 146457]
MCEGSGSSALLFHSMKLERNCMIQKLDSLSQTGRQIKTGLKNIL